jgi:molybdopterin-guanine dinucleotide biosynthesis protein A
MSGSVTGMILAGGSSRRMGTDKSFLDLGGKPVVERTIEILTGSFDRVLIITNDPDKYARFGLPMRPDIIPGIGVLAGIHAGLSYLKDGAAFFAASDMPFIRPALVEYLVGAFEDTDAVVPYFRGEYEPLLALYSKKCLSAVEKSINARKRRAISFLSNVRVRLVREGELIGVDPDLISFFNINTPEDYERAKRIAEESGP